MKRCHVHVYYWVFFVERAWVWGYFLPTIYECTRNTRFYSLLHCNKPTSWICNILLLWATGFCCSAFTRGVGARLCRCYQRCVSMPVVACVQAPPPIARCPLAQSLRPFLSLLFTLDSLFPVDRLNLFFFFFVIHEGDPLVTKFEVE